MSLNQNDPATDTAGVTGIDASIIDFRVRVPVGMYPANVPPPEHTERYEAVLSTVTKTEDAPSLDDLLAQMDAQGVGHAVMHAEYEAGDPADDLNRAVAGAVAKYPDRFTGIGTISMHPFSIKRALRQVDECVEMGMIGLSLEPAFFDLAITDRRLYPIYAKAAEESLLVALHTGINYATNRPMTGEHPLQLEQLCCDFNELIVVASHAGWPWVPEMVAVARKHPNVYLEFGGLAPRYVGETGTGWEMMRRFMDSVLSGQILFGTDWPVMDHERLLSEWRDVGLKPDVLEALLGRNARDLLSRLRPASAGAATRRQHETDQ